MSNVEASLKRDLTAQTGAISRLLTNYAKLAQQASTSYSSSGLLKDDIGRRKDEQEGELDGVLEQFSELIEKLSNHQATSHPPPSASATYMLERHRETLQEYRKDYQRQKASLREAEQRANLLGSVRDEISAFKSNTNTSATDSLLSDRNRIDNSHSMIDDITRQAHETRYAFSEQRSGIQAINARMNGVIASVPALNSILGMINTRRSRDSVIVGTTLGVCIVFMMWYLFG